MAEVEEEEEEEKRLRGWPAAVVAVEGALPNDDSSKTTRRNAREEHEVSNEKTSENSAEVSTLAVLKTPDDWCRTQGVQVLDPDGWRGRNGRPWEDPISLAEFQERLVTCTQRVEVKFPADQEIAFLDGITIAGNIVAPPGSHWESTIIDAALWTGGPRYRIHLGHLNVWPLAIETTRDQAAAMAKGLRDNGPHHVRLVEITETATEIQLDEETKA
jgi:hypothetical protein